MRAPINEARLSEIERRCSIIELSLTPSDVHDMIEALRIALEALREVGAREDERWAYRSAQIAWDALERIEGPDDAV